MPPRRRKGYDQVEGFLPRPRSLNFAAKSPLQRANNGRQNRLPSKDIEDEDDLVAATSLCERERHPR